MTDPDYVKNYHEILVCNYIERNKPLLNAIKDYVDIVMVDSNDQGTQASSMLPPHIFHELYTPYYKQINKMIHSIKKEYKTFLHSCGAIYELMDYIIEGDFDVLNPVQWSAGGHSYREWKDKARNKIALWGGGINSQHTLPSGSVREVAEEAQAVSEYLRKEGGFVFNPIHNILAEIEPEKIIAMYEAADRKIAPG